MGTLHGGRNQRRGFEFKGGPLLEKSGGIDSSGDKFVVLPKMVKCALAPCHSNADVERSLSVNKRMLTTKMNTIMSDETINGLRSIKAAVQEYGHASKVPITLEMVKVQNSYKLYSQHIGEEQQRNKTREKKKNRLKLTRGNEARRIKVT